MGITFKSIKYIYIYVYFYIFHFFSFFFFFFPFQVIDDIADRLLEFISKNLIFKNDEDNEEPSDQDDGKISFELLRRSSSIPQEGDKNIVITDETVDGKEQNLLLLTTLKDNYYEKPYEKNIIGGLKEIAWQVKKEKGKEIGREIKGERDRKRERERERKMGRAIVMVLLLLIIIIFLQC